MTVRFPELAWAKLINACPVYLLAIGSVLWTAALTCPSHEYSSQLPDSSQLKVRSYLGEHPDVRLVLMDDGLQHLPLVRGSPGGGGELPHAAASGAAGRSSAGWSNVPTHTPTCPQVRDLEIVMVNSLSPFGNGHLLPRGTLRELPRAALRRADAVVLHHADLAGGCRPWGSWVSGCPCVCGEVRHLGVGRGFSVLDS